MKLTLQDLKTICPQASAANLAKYINPLNAYMEDYSINTHLRASHFIAQLAHESAQFNYVRELASGAAYEGRKDLGNVVIGDGKLFKGRGLIQITGRNNYKRVSEFIFKDGRLLSSPGVLEQPEYAVLSAVWFWAVVNNLNLFADKDDVNAITRRINGGFNGLAERKAFLQRAKTVLANYYT